MAESLRHLAEKIFRRNDEHREPSLFADREPFQTRRLEAHVELLLTQASAASIAGQEEDARRLYHDAANAAARAYSEIETFGITSEDRILKGRHAEVAVTSYINAGELPDALRFGKLASQDLILPEVSRSRIQTAMEISA